MFYFVITVFLDITVLCVKSFSSAHYIRRIIFIKVCFFKFSSVDQ